MLLEIDERACESQLSNVFLDHALNVLRYPFSVPLIRLQAIPQSRHWLSFNLTSPLPYCELVESTQHYLSLCPRPLQNGRRERGKKGGREGGRFVLKVFAFLTYFIIIIIPISPKI